MSGCYLVFASCLILRCAPSYFYVSSGRPVRIGGRERTAVPAGDWRSTTLGPTSRWRDEGISCSFSKFDERRDGRGRERKDRLTQTIINAEVPGKSVIVGSLPVEAKITNVILLNIEPEENTMSPNLST